VRDNYNLELIPLCFDKEEDKDTITEVETKYGVSFKGFTVLLVASNYIPPILVFMSTCKNSGILNDIVANFVEYYKESLSN
jgi:esterase/lipase